MKLEHRLNLPQTGEKLFDKYRQLLDLDTAYSAWTILDNLEVVPCEGKLTIEEYEDHHNGNDYYFNKFMVYIKDDKKSVIQERWWTLNKSEVLDIQRKCIEEWNNILSIEAERLYTLIAKNTKTD